ncbi:MAG: hypothetical protein IKW56_02395, partial [Methanocorpusculum sp.]|nr:hypothetical protein [Methanocorpusculum sp.]
RKTASKPKNRQTTKKSRQTMSDVSDKPLKTQKDHLRNGDTITEHVTISIREQDKAAWQLWKSHPANRRISGALMRLVRRDLRDHKEQYGISL